MISPEYENIDVRFDAVLKTFFGKTIEFGHGQYDPAARSVDFESDFIPLFPMGTKLQIFRLHEGIEVHRFVGEVYFSSAGRLRLVSVQDEIPPEAALVFLYHVNLTGVAQTSVQTEHRGLFGKKTVEEVVEFPVKITALSTREVQFLTDLSVELDLEQPVLLLPQGAEAMRLPVVVQRAIVFGQEANSYRCKLLTLHAADKQHLEDLILKLSLAQAPRSL